MYKICISFLCFILFASIDAKAFQSDHPQTYALVAGVSAYQDSSITDLKYADKDALAFANFLKSSAGGELDDQHLKVLLNEEATMANFAVELYGFMSNAKQGDNVIIFFSGHGDVEKMSVSQPGYLLFWDAPYQIYMMGGAFALTTLQDVITTLSAVNQANLLVITDACRSGNLAGESVNGSEVTGSNLAKQYSNETKILSCQPDELSIEGKQWGGGRGAFSYHLINGLYGMADENEDYAVDLREIRNYLEDRVTKEVEPNKQVPMTVGNSSTHLFDVDPDALENAIATDTLSSDFSEPVTARGFEDDVLLTQEDEVNILYKNFNAALESNRFMEPEDNCAEFYFEQLMEISSISEIHDLMRRNFSAALQNNAQQIIKKILSDDTQELALSKSTKIGQYNNYPKHLERASELLGPGHFMDSIIQGRKLFFEGFLIATEHTNPDTVAGRKALNKFKASLSFLPDMALDYLYMSRVYALNMTMIDSAKYYADLASGESPTWILPLTTMSYLYSTKFGDHENSEKYLKKVDQINPNSILGLNAWGNHYYQNNMYEEAEKKYLKCLSIDSNYIHGITNLAHIYERQNKLEASEKYFMKAISIDSTQALIHNNLGVVYLKKKRYKEATKYFMNALKRDSTLVNPDVNLGVIHMRQENDKLAIKYLTRALKNNPNHIVANYNLGILHQRKGHMFPAIRRFQKVLENNPNHINSLNALAGIYTDNGKYDEAEELLNQAITIDSMSTMSYSNLGYNFLVKDDLEKAESAYNKAIEIDSNFLDAYSSLGMMYLNTAKYAQAREHYLKMIDINSELSSPYVYLACISSLEGDTAVGFEQLEKAFLNGWSDLKGLNNFDELQNLRNNKNKWDTLVAKYSK